ncbi:urea amidolyase [Defluviimonas sp. WL0024]|uniref:Urea amidolyase n=1 Tax=Albidovulum salinarum TaxID=2984153 RepID=A0ABT2X6L1_9RHOB|nr:biotin-dependent carboxyltransferase family protein [Defluviimonas sp. WL0024]MCU9849582.1 urea amidolyase [Defluviimonas sp. WL0024]
MSALLVLAAGPGVTVQDRGRPGWLAQGLSRGGAADVLALAEGAALLGQTEDCAAVEMAMSGGTFEAEGDLIIALTGASMAATLDGVPLAWNATHRLGQGQRLVIGGAKAGVYGYLHVAGGIATAPVMGSRSAHLTAGLGAAVGSGDRLPVGEAGPTRPGLGIAVADRFSGGAVGVVPSAQTGLFAPAERDRFAAATFTRDARGNRQGVRLVHDGAPFAATEGQLSIASEIIVPGDIQMTGDGTPYVLLPECQTMGGYPRIGTVVPQDLPIVAQAAPGTRLRFRFVTREEALADLHRQGRGAARFSGAIRPLLRDPGDIADLLAYQLIGGVTAGADLDGEDGA